jgi:hypothetical protein
MGGISEQELAGRYPRLYHMAEWDAWPSIRQHGLLSTTALLDLFGIGGEDRRRIESCHRPKKITISSPNYGKAVIRDQKPMRPATLNRCLSDMSESGWYELLNRRVFLWLHENRLNTLLSARAYRNERHCVLTFPTGPLLKAYGDTISLSALNTGSTLYNPPVRGSRTFCSLATYPFAERHRKAGAQNAIVELAVDYGIPNAAELCERAVIMQGAVVLETIFVR